MAKPSQRRHEKRSKRPIRRRSSDAEQLYAAEIGAHPLLTPTEELELGSSLEAAEVALWKSLLEGPFSSEARRFLELEEPTAASSPEAARSADLDRLIFIELLAAITCNPDPALAHEIRSIQRLSAETVRLREHFVRCNLRLVPSTIYRFGFHLKTTLSMGDLIQEGNLGLIKAVPRFDHRRGCRFSTFATWWIRHFLLNAKQCLGTEVRVPSHVQELVSKVRQAKIRLQRNSDYVPSLDDISRELDISKKRLRALEQDWPKYPEPLVPFDPTGMERSKDTFLISADPSAVEALSSRQTQEQIDEALACLPPQLAQIIRRRFGFGTAEPETLLQIGESLHLSRERIRQLENKALGLLRQKLARAARLYDSME